MPDRARGYLPASLALSGIAQGYVGIEWKESTKWLGKLQR